MKNVSGTITIMNNISSLTGSKLILKINISNNLFPINILTKPAGAFLTLGFLIALFNYIKGGKNNESN